MNPIDVFIYAIVLLFAGSIVTLIWGAKRNVIGMLSLLFTVLSAGGIYYVVFYVFVNGTIHTTQPLWEIHSLNASLILKIDYLSALFLAIIALISVLVGLYSLNYMRLAIFAEYSLRSYYPVLLVFFAGVMCVVSVADLFFFFIFWEVMTLASYLLVIYQKKDRQVLRAGFKYFLMTHIATALLFVAAIIVATYGSGFAFTGLSQGMQILATDHPVMLHVVLLFFFLGFATKAGILPMGDWLPDAYPSAPTPATAAFAGSMTKLGIYGVIRIFCDILPLSSHTQAWGLWIAVFGTLSIFVGTMTALVQENSKRLLSFHVIGQMGYMFLGIGMGIHFLPTHPVLGVIAIGGGVFHLVNHVCYKACLFFNAGSVHWKVGSQDINQVGGLARLLPLTALTTLIASLAIAGIPPFSGFSSKWIIYQSAIRAGFTSPIFIAMGIIAIFVSAVTLASFIKFFGAIFYGKFNDNHSGAPAGDVPLSMQIPQWTLAFLCIFFGLVPIIPIRMVYNAISRVFDPALATGSFADIYGSGFLGGISLSFNAITSAGWNPLIILFVALGCGLIGLFFFKAGGAPQRESETWYCGEAHHDENVRYRAGNFYLPFKKLFYIRIVNYFQEGIYPKFHWKPLKLNPAGLVKRMLDIDHWFYHPLVEGFMKLMRRFSVTHVGIPHVYLLWLVIGALVTIALMFWLSGHTPG